MYKSYANKTLPTRRAHTMLPISFYLHKMTKLRIPFFRPRYIILSENEILIKITVTTHNIVLNALRAANRGSECLIGSR